MFAPLKERLARLIQRTRYNPLSEFGDGKIGVRIIRVIQASTKERASGGSSHLLSSSFASTPQVSPPKPSLRGWRRPWPIRQITQPWTRPVVGADGGTFAHYGGRKVCHLVVALLWASGREIGESMDY